MCRQVFFFFKRLNAFVLFFPPLFPSSSLPLVVLSTNSIPFPHEPPPPSPVVTMIFFYRISFSSPPGTTTSSFFFFDNRKQRRTFFPGDPPHLFFSREVTGAFFPPPSSPTQHPPSPVAEVTPFPHCSLQLFCVWGLMRTLFITSFFFFPFELPFFHHFSLKNLHPFSSPYFGVWSSVLFLFFPWGFGCFSPFVSLFVHGTSMSFVPWFLSLFFLYWGMVVYRIMSFFSFLRVFPHPKGFFLSCNHRWWFLFFSGELVVFFELPPLFFFCRFFFFDNPPFLPPKAVSILSPPQPSHFLWDLTMNLPPYKTYRVCEP